MSRMGHRPVDIPDDVDVEISDDEITASGSAGERTEPILGGITIEEDDGELILQRRDDSKQQRSRHGLMRKLVKNLVEDVSEPYEKVLELNGIGYRTHIEGGSIVLELGFSHPVEIDIPEGIDLDVPNNTTIKVSGVDRQEVGQFAAKLRDLRDPDPYNQKGIKYKGEHIRQKVGKAVGGEGADEI